MPFENPYGSIALSQSFSVLSIAISSSKNKQVNEIIVIAIFKIGLDLYLKPQNSRKGIVTYLPAHQVRYNISKSCSDDLLLLLLVVHVLAVSLYRKLAIAMSLLVFK